MKTKSICRGHRFVLVLGVVCVASQSVPAQFLNPSPPVLLPVPNFSFERPDRPDGENTASPFGGWQGSGRVFDFTDTQYPGANGDNSPLPGTAEGGQGIRVTGEFFSPFDLVKTSPNTTY